MGSRIRDFVLVLAVAMGMAALAWIAGFATAMVVTPAGPAVPDDIQPPSNFGLYGEVWRMIDQEFYGQHPAPRAVAEHAVEGLVDALGDPYADYVDPATAATLGEDYLPELVDGLGAWVEPVTNGALVVATAPGSPAAEHLLPGDVIVVVGEDELAGLGRKEMRDLLSGKAGSSVRLIVLHESERGEAMEVQRESVALPDVKVTQPAPHVDYFRLTHFDPEVVKGLDDALAALSSDPPEALVIDLRDNPGGDLDSVRAIAGRFMDGKVWIEVDHDGSQTEQDADSSGAPDVALPKRVVVLVNAGTAGAAEILAGALRDNLGAQLVGETTFGKGSLQAVTGLSDHSAIRLTTGHWRTPAGTEVEGVGLAPDVDVALSAEDRAADRDPQLDAAVAAAQSDVVTDREDANTGG